MSKMIIQPKVQKHKQLVKFIYMMEALLGCLF